MNSETLDTKELESPYAKSFHIGLLRSLVRDKQRRKNPIKPFALGGPKPKIRKHLKTLKHLTKISNLNQAKKEIKSKIKFRIIGLQSIADMHSDRVNVFG